MTSIGALRVCNARRISLSRTHCTVETRVICTLSSEIGLMDLTNHRTSTNQWNEFHQPMKRILANQMQSRAGLCRNVSAVPVLCAFWFFHLLVSEPVQMPCKPINLPTSTDSLHIHKHFTGLCMSQLKSKLYWTELKIWALHYYNIVQREKCVLKVIRMILVALDSNLPQQK